MPRPACGLAFLIRLKNGLSGANWWAHMTHTAPGQSFPQQQALDQHHGRECVGTRCVWVDVGNRRWNIKPISPGNMRGLMPSVGRSTSRMEHPFKWRGIFYAWMGSSFATLKAKLPLIFSAKMMMGTAFSAGSWWGLFFPGWKSGTATTRSGGTRFGLIPCVRDTDGRIMKIIGCGTRISSAPRFWICGTLPPWLGHSPGKGRKLPYKPRLLARV